MSPGTGAGNLFVIDGDRNPRIAKFDRRGRFVTAAGGRGVKPGELNSPHALAVDANGTSMSPTAATRVSKRSVIANAASSVVMDDPVDGAQQHARELLREAG
jgi:hypothetical protein